MADSMLKVTKDCMELIFPTNADAIDKAGGVGGGGFGLGGMGGNTPPFVKPSTPLYWRGGARVGETVYRMPITRLKGKDGARQCFENMIDWRVEGRKQVPTRYVELCVDPGAVISSR